MFHNLICCFPVAFTLFCPKCELKLSDMIFLIVTPLQKLVLAPGASIRDNTVYTLIITCMLIAASSDKKHLVRTKSFERS